MCQTCDLEDALQDRRVVDEYLATKGLVSRRSSGDGGPNNAVQPVFSDGQGEAELVSETWAGLPELCPECQAPLSQQGVGAGTGDISWADFAVCGRGHTISLL